MPEPIIAATFAALLAGFSDCFTKPSFAVFQHMVSGWIMCIGRHTVTGVIQAGGVVGVRHHTSFQRFFRCGRWQPDEVGLALLRMVLKLVPPFAPVIVAVDDTLARHTGKRISSAGMHRDPLLSTAAKTVHHFGHIWVVLAVVVKVPEWNKCFALPVLVRLYRSKKTCENMGKPHRKKTELSVELIKKLASAIPKRRIVVVGDNAYANREVLTRLPANTDFVGRGVLDARIFELPPAKKPGQMGRPRVVGKKLPSPRERAEDPNAPWQNVEVKISGRPARIRVLVFNALWHKSGKGRYLRFVFIRDWPGHAKDDVLLCTDTSKSAQWIIESYCLRWPIEVTFYWCKGKLGLQQPQNRKERAVQRTAPMALWSYSLVILWYMKTGQHCRAARIRRLPWYQSKKTPAFSDMLATLRRESWSARLQGYQRLCDRALPERTIQNSMDDLLEAIGFG